MHSICSAVIAVALGFTAIGCSPSETQATVTLCLEHPNRKVVWIDLSNLTYNMSDFETSIALCSNQEFFCMRLPLIMSSPYDLDSYIGKSWSTSLGAHTLLSEDGELSFETKEITEAAQSELIEITRSRVVFDQSGQLVSSTIFYEDPDTGREVNETQRVCDGSLALKDLLELKPSRPSENFG